MNGKDYVNGAMELTERLVSEIEKSNLLEGDTIIEGTTSACKSLGNMKNKPTLRTKAGANLAFPVYDAAQKLEEAWEEAQEENDTDELTSQMDEFIRCVEALVAALKDRTVIMT